MSHPREALSSVTASSISISQQPARRPTRSPPQPHPKVAEQRWEEEEPSYEDDEAYDKSEEEEEWEEPLEIDDAAEEGTAAQTGVGGGMLWKGGVGMDRLEAQYHSLQQQFREAVATSTAMPRRTNPTPRTTLAATRTSGTTSSSTLQEDPLSVDPFSTRSSGAGGTFPTFGSSAGASSHRTSDREASLLRFHEVGAPGLWGSPLQLFSNNEKVRLKRSQQSWMNMMAEESRLYGHAAEAMLRGGAPHLPAESSNEPPSPSPRKLGTERVERSSGRFSHSHSLDGETGGSGRQVTVRPAHYSCVSSSPENEINGRGAVRKCFTGTPRTDLMGTPPSTSAVPHRDSSCDLPSVHELEEVEEEVDTAEEEILEERGEDDPAASKESLLLSFIDLCIEREVREEVIAEYVQFMVETMRDTVSLHGALQELYQQHKIDEFQLERYGKRAAMAMHKMERPQSQQGALSGRRRKPSSSSRSGSGTSPTHSRGNHRIETASLHFCPSWRDRLQPYSHHPCRLSTASHFSSSSPPFRKERESPCPAGCGSSTYQPVSEGLFSEPYSPDRAGPGWGLQPEDQSGDLRAFTPPSEKLERIAEWYKQRRNELLQESTRVRQPHHEPPLRKPQRPASQKNDRPGTSPTSTSGWRKYDKTGTSPEAGLRPRSTSASRVPFRPDIQRSSYPHHSGEALRTCSIKPEGFVTASPQLFSVWNASKPTNVSTWNSPIEKLSGSRDGELSSWRQCVDRVGPAGTTAVPSTASAMPLPSGWNSFGACSIGASSVIQSAVQVTSPSLQVFLEQSQRKIREVERVLQSKSLLNTQKPVLRGDEQENETQIPSSASSGTDAPDSFSSAQLEEPEGRDGAEVKTVMNSSLAQDQ